MGYVVATRRTALHPEYLAHDQVRALLGVTSKDPLIVVVGDALGPLVGHVLAGVGRLQRRVQAGHPLLLQRHSVDGRDLDRHLRRRPAHCRCRKRRRQHAPAPNHPNHARVPLLERSIESRIMQTAGQRQTQTKRRMPFDLKWRGSASPAACGEQAGQSQAQQRQRRRLRNRLGHRADLHLGNIEHRLVTCASEQADQRSGARAEINAVEPGCAVTEG